MNRLFATKVISCIAILTFFYSCKDKKLHPDVSHIEVNVNVIPFYQEFNNMDTVDILTSFYPLQKKYPTFTEAYNQQIIKIGSSEAPDFEQKLLSFVKYDANKDIIEEAKVVFSDHHKMFSKELEEGFKHYKYYFPEADIPVIYLMISGFSQSIAVDDSWVAVSIEKYLGAECRFYEWIGIQKYLRKGMVKEKMAPDVLRAMALTNYKKNTEVNDVINNMIYTGKIRYFVHRLFPDLQDTLLFDYSGYQMNWCEDHEADAWASMVEWKHVFSDDRMLIRKYTGDAPFTANFGDNSAPRAGEYIGYKIVESYMKNNEEVTLKDLMYDTDGRRILAASEYRP